jgi:hypothetical protein
MEETKKQDETDQLGIGAVIGSILKELKERKQWAENGMIVYSDDTGMRIEYQARIEEIENAIWVVSQYCQ